MKPVESATIIKRMDSLWSREMGSDAKREWTMVLKPLNYEIAGAALDEMRDTLMFPPSVADFRSAYYSALALGAGSVLALPAGDETPTPLRDRYGEDQRSWVYCWRCDMALTLEERDSGRLSGYDESRGLYHRKCPKSGSAPTIPAAERLVRDEYLARRKIAIGRNVEPLPYRG